MLSALPSQKRSVSSLSIYSPGMMVHQNSNECRVARQRRPIGVGNKIGWHNYIESANLQPRLDGWLACRPANHVAPDDNFSIIRGHPHGMQTMRATIEAEIEGACMHTQVVAHLL